MLFWVSADVRSTEERSRERNSIDHEWNNQEEGKKKKRKKVRFRGDFECVGPTRLQSLSNDFREVNPKGRDQMR